MSLQTRLADLVVAVGTDYKQLRTWMTGTSTGDPSTGLNTTSKNLVGAINEVNSKAAPAAVAATETVAGVAEVATQAETNSGLADNLFVTPLKFATRLAAYAQPLSTNLTNLAGVASTAWGRARLADADQAAARTALGLSAVAISGSASDITTGTLPTSVLPAIAIHDTFVVANQAAMLALTAQKGDIAKRTDLNGTPFVLSTNSPSTLADWISLDTTSDVTSVNGQTGTVVLAKGDVGLGNVDNTSDANKPVSTAQATAIGLKMDKAQNLNDVANKATARDNLDVYGKSDIGNPDVDLVSAYNTAKA